MNNLVKIAATAALASLLLAVSPAQAGCIGGDPVCTMTDPTPDDQMITLVITPDACQITSATVTTTNALPNQATTNTTCVNQFSCELTITQVAPGPSSWEVVVVDADNNSATCGPYTNADGLPVTLLSFSVEEDE